MILYLVIGLVMIISTIIWLKNLNDINYSYYYLSIWSISLFSVWLLNYDKKGWLLDLTFNLSLQLIGILVVAFMVNRIIDNNHIAEKRKYEFIAISQLRMPLVHHIDFLFNLYKATLPTKPEIQFKEVSELFTEDFILNITSLDFTKKAPVYPQMQYFDYCFIEVNRLKEGLMRTVDKYSVYLSAETIDLIEKAANSDFIKLLEVMKSIREMDLRENLKRKYDLLAGEESKNDIREYFSLITNLTDKVNSAFEVEKRITIGKNAWSDNIAPKIGSGRLGQ